MKNPNQHKDRALYVMVGGSLVVNALLWFFNKYSEQLTDNTGGWGLQPIDLILLLLYVVALVFFVPILVYLVKMAFMPLPDSERIKKVSLCLLAITSFTVAAFGLI